MRIQTIILFMGGLGLILGGCNRQWPGPSQAAAPTTPVSTSLPTIQPSPTLPPTLVPMLPTATIKPAQKIWIDPALTGQWRDRFRDLGVLIDGPSESANLKITIGPGAVQIGQWYFALAGPFPTLVDGASLADLKATWQGNPSGVFQNHSILMDEKTRQTFERSWGPAGKQIRIVDSSQILDTAWQEKSSWAIVPFEALAPGWKVLRLDGKSPLDRNFDPASYGLTFPVSLDGETTALNQVRQKQPQLLNNVITNRDPQKLTVVVMTGVSALVRGTAWYMEKKGLLYPDRDIRNWLRDADITHVSNEISFNSQCPYPDPNDPDLKFCSDPKYIQLFEDAGVDIVEMTGNHLNDFGSNWVGFTIDLYRQRNWLYYGAGLNQEEARKPVTIVHNGNKIAFIGCNPAGPGRDWATTTQPGTADCAYPNMDYLVSEIQWLKSEGFLTIVTLQYFESYDPRPLPMHYKDFRRLSDAGAIIVSGSQAHLPQAIELRNQGLIHYGLGNLFFDQMDTPWPDTKDEFIDRHVFYDGRYLGVELLTAQIEDYVKPRPMTSQERTNELTQIFEVSGWSQASSKQWSRGQ